MMKLLISIFILINWLLLNGNLAFASEIVLPSPTGIYAVGTFNLELSDPSRVMLRSLDNRRWMATVFYPAQKTEDKSPYMPGTLEDGVVCGVKVLAHAKPEAIPLLTKKFPLIIAIPGRGGERQRYTILCQDLASHGYSIIAIDQPYVANFVKFVDGEKITLTFKDVWYLPRDRDYRYKYDDEAIRGAIGDIDYVLKNFDHFGEAAKAFDRDKIILLGHSLGGNVAHIMGFSDKRIKAIIDIDSKITERKIYGRIGVPPNLDKKPILFIRGSMQYQEDVGNQLTKIANSTIWSPDVQHSAFSDGAYFAAKIPRYGMGFWHSLYNWLFKRGPYFSNTDTNLGEKNVDEWFQEYPTHIVSWLKGHL